MTLMNRTVRSIVAIGGVLAASCTLTDAARAQSVSGETKIDLEVKPFVRLYYSDNVNITLSPGSKEGSETNPLKPVTVDASYSAEGGVSGETNVGVTATSNNAKGKINLQNFWAVQSIADKGTRVTLKVANPTAKLEGRESSLEIADVSTDVPEFEPTGLAGSQSGNATVVVDMQKARHAGKYTGASISITAENF